MTGPYEKGRGLSWSERSKKERINALIELKCEVQEMVEGDKTYTLLRKEGGLGNRQNHLQQIERCNQVETAINKQLLLFTSFYQSTEVSATVLPYPYCKHKA